MQTSARERDVALSWDPNMACEVTSESEGEGIVRRRSLRGDGGAVARCSEVCLSSVLTQSGNTGEQVTGGPVLRQGGSKTRDCHASTAI